MWNVCPLHWGVSVTFERCQFLNRLYVTEGEQLTVQAPTWKAEFLALKEQEPPDSWDTESSDPPPSSKMGLQPWKGAAGFVPKTVVTVKPPVESKQVAIY